VSYQIIESGRVGPMLNELKTITNDELLNSFKQKDGCIYHFSYLTDRVQ
jgi:hypothetical protein